MKIGLIIGFALLLRIIFFVGPTVPDEFAYLQHAYNIFRDTFDIAGGAWYAFRFMVFFPVGIFFKLFGVNDYAAVIWPLLSSLGCIVLTFLIGKLLFDTKKAFFAAVLLSIFPLDVLYSTHLMPDTILPLFMALSMYLFLKAEQACIKKKSSVFYLFSGVALGLGYLTRAIAPILFLFFLIFYILYKKSFKFEYLLTFLGFLLIPFTEMTLYYVLAGDFLLRWHITYNFYQSQQLPINLLYYPKAIFSPFGYFGIFYYLIFGGILYLTFKKKLRSIAIPLIWFLSSFLYMEFGTMSLSAFVPIFKNARFLSVISIPAVIISAYSLSNLPLEKMGISKNQKVLNNFLIFLCLVTIGVFVSFYFYKEGLFRFAKNIYNLAEHVYSFEEKIGMFNRLFKIMMLILPLELGASFLIINTKKAISQRTKLICLIIIIILLPSSIFSVSIYSAQYKNNIDKYKLTYRFIKEVSANSIYCIHWRWPMVLSYYFKYGEGSNFLCRDRSIYPKTVTQSSIFKYVHNAKSASEIKDSYVIVDKRFLQDFLGSTPPPEYIYSIPKNWKIIKKIKDTTIYYTN